MRVLTGKGFRDYLLRTNTKIHDLTFLPCLRYHIVRRLNNLVQIKFSANVILQPLDNIFINKEIYDDEVYDRFYNIREEDTVIDVGAHVGVFTLKIARKVKRGLVIAIEPHPFNYRLLMNNVEFNKLTNIKALRLALSSFNGVVKLYLSNRSGTHSLRFRKNSSKYLEVQAKTLDTIIEELNISKVDLIKIDAEGAELEIIRGAKNTVKRNDVFLSIAAYHTPTEAQEISTYLQEIGFKVLRRVREGTSYVYAFKSTKKVDLKK